ncbi:MAG: PilZ domain-containing protein [Phycisphaerales bacterium]
MRPIRNMSPLPLANGHSGPNKRTKGRLRCELLTCELGAILDVSASGMRIDCGKLCPVQVGQTLPLTLRAASQSLAAIARVAWVRRSGHDTQQAGVEFVETSPAFAQALRELTLTCMEMRSAMRV